MLEKKKPGKTYRSIHLNLCLINNIFLNINCFSEKLFFLRRDFEKKKNENSAVSVMNANKSCFFFFSGSRHAIYDQR